VMASGRWWRARRLPRQRPAAPPRPPPADADSRRRRAAAAAAAAPLLPALMRKAVHDKDGARHAAGPARRARRGREIAKAAWCLLTSSRHLPRARPGRRRPCPLSPRGMPTGSRTTVRAGAYVCGGLAGPAAAVAHFLRAAARAWD
jgi:hypothetical protein